MSIVVPEEKKSWGRAALLSGALLVIPALGLVLLLLLPDDEPTERPVASRVDERDRPAAPPPPPDPVPAPRPRLAPDPEPAMPDDPVDAPLEEEPVEEEREPSVLDPCCAALDERVSKEPTGILRAAQRACDRARGFDDPAVGFRTVSRILDRQGYEVPRACEP